MHFLIEKRHIRFQQLNSLEGNKKNAVKGHEIKSTSEDGRHKHFTHCYDPVVKTVQPSLKTGRKWKVTESVDEAKECLKEVIGQTQTDRRGLGSTTAKRWSKTEGKQKKGHIIDEIRNKKDSTHVQKAVQQPQQGQWTNWDTAIQRSLTWNDIWHMASLRISFLIRSVYDLLPSNANLIRWGKKDDPTCPLCQNRQTTEHVLSSCKVALSQGRYTWRHNRVLQELASVISIAKGKSSPLQQAQQYSPQKVESKNGTESRLQ
ncbi:polyprotein [Plakobranchus ocellatus]|uniref:Polyprotein n=1 Tax=Plakobranchus ocellatus TaxID=259542 RepID=A0AAV4C8G0_9GAST|nr:polyprotein [Plakobranchus ocellatus]